jgi:hypothetical protein
MILLLILGVSGVPRKDYDQDHEQEQEGFAPFTPEWPMLPYGFDDAESAISVA